MNIIIFKVNEDICRHDSTTTINKAIDLPLLDFEINDAMTHLIAIDRIDALFHPLFPFLGFNQRICE
jgi:hypothetical protein